MILPASVWGANGQSLPGSRVGVALIGRGAMGGGHLRRLISDPAFQVLAVCDVDRQRRETGRDIANEFYAANRGKDKFQSCVACNDYREILSRSDIDAVLIATPDHWHSFQSIDAARAGKDVYCEKPVSVTVEEGRRVVEAVRRYGRVFQTGTQYRSIPTIREVCQFVRQGGLGKVKSVFTMLTNLGTFIGGERFKPYSSVMNPAVCAKGYVPLDFALPAEPVPEGLDWDLWVGPGPFHPYNSLFHINPSPGVVPWSFCDAFGVTSSTWHLSHSVDVIQYALGMENSGPVEIIHPSTGEFPTLTCRYATGTLLHFVDHWGLVKDPYHAVPEKARLAGLFGGIFVGERGWLTSMTTGGPIEGGPEDVFEAMKLKTREVNIGANNHHENWLECIHSRRSPSSNEEIGHRSASLGHIAYIALQTGQSLRWDPVLEQFAGNSTANRLLSRLPRPPWRL
ncbi:MAG TPA: Gfo/Idh/MocA family oxidoreductase [Candidatus Paceibacterota bacterium]|nr:Gfo/Idh/MocA family oxidoreductase [Verrucomicrobiota bacterium]HRY49624.1 Gfo/Idh/MocA family oxidoreductase [Candidatus Paceibacterota bacterium]HSA00101.1 Gfo/Idh/MocA family oxidoreductase [Candidatus Paceibacterota bacterium]